MEEKDLEQAFGETAEALKPVIGKENDLSEFVIMVNDNLDVVAKTADGWSITIPSLTGAWSVLVGWIIRGDESAISSIKAYLGMIVFPVSMLLPAGDEEFFGDIAKAQDSLFGRNGGNIDVSHVSSPEAREALKKAVYGE